MQRFAFLRLRAGSTSPSYCKGTGKRELGGKGIETSGPSVSFQAFLAQFFLGEGGPESLRAHPPLRRDPGCGGFCDRCSGPRNTPLEWKRQPYLYANGGGLLVGLFPLAFPLFFLLLIPTNSYFCGVFLCANRTPPPGSPPLLPPPCQQARRAPSYTATACPSLPKVPQGSLQKGYFYFFSPLRNYLI